MYDVHRDMLERKLLIIAHYLKERLLRGKPTPGKMLVPIFQEHNRQVAALIGKEYAKGTLNRYETSLKHTQAFLRWKFNSSDEGLLLQKMNSYLKEIADACGISKELTYHIARHTFATTVTLANGVSIESVYKMLGHTNIKTTQHYAKILDMKVAQDMSKLRQLY